MAYAEAMTMNHLRLDSMASKFLQPYFFVSIVSTALNSAIFHGGVTAFKHQAEPEKLLVLHFTAAQVGAMKLEHGFGCHGIINCMSFPKKGKLNFKRHL